MSYQVSQLIRQILNAFCEMALQSLESLFGFWLYSLTSPIPALNSQSNTAYEPVPYESASEQNLSTPICPGKAEVLIVFDCAKPIPSTLSDRATLMDGELQCKILTMER
jgi:hypothetical protein